MHKLIFFVFLIFPLLVFSQVNELIAEGTDLLEKSKPDEALVIFEKIEANYFDELPKRAKIYLFVNFSKTLRLKNDYSKCLEYLLKAKNLNVNDSIQHQNIYNSTFAELFFELGAFDLSIDYYKRYTKIEQDEFNRYLAFNRIGVMYLKLNKINKALFYFNEQLKEAKKLKRNLHFYAALNNIAIVHISNKEYTKALDLFKGIEKNYAEKNEDPIFYINVLENIGSAFYHLKQYQKAVLYFEKVNEYQTKNNIFLENLKAQKLLGLCYLELNRFEDAKKMEKQIISFYSQLKLLEKIDFLNFRMELYHSLDDKKMSKSLLDEFKTLNDLLNNEIRIKNNNTANLVSIYLVSVAKIKLENEKKIKENTQRALMLEERENGFYVFAFISICVLLVFSTFLFVQNTKRKRKRMLLEKERLLLEEERLKHKIEIQNKNLTEFAIDISHKKELNEEIVSELKKVVKLDNEYIKIEINKLILELKTKDFSKKSLPNVNEETEFVLLQFKNKLFELFPKLTKTDIEICTLIKLNLSNKEIANFKNVTDYTIKTMKTRLKKKLNLDESQNLHLFLAEINF